MVSFNWLHITDLHIGMSGQSWLLPNVETDFLNDVERLHQYCGPLDLVCFTGDLVQQGKPQEFDRVNEFLDRLWKHLDKLGSSPFLIALPGNHDLVRPRKNHRLVVDAIRNLRDRPDHRDEFWSEPKCQMRRIVKQAFSNYTKWWDTHKFQRLPNYYQGIMPGDFSASLEKDGIKLGIAGLNSTFVQLDGGDYEGRLVISVEQFHKACKGNGAKWSEEHHFCILMTHQPPNWLEPQSRQDLDGEIARPGRFGIHLFGHMHEHNYSSISIGASEVRRCWQGLSLFGLEQWGNGNTKIDRRHGYSVGHLDFDGNIARLRMWPRKAERHPAGHMRIIPDYNSFELLDDQGTPAEECRLILRSTPVIATMKVDAVSQSGNLLPPPEHNLNALPVRIEAPPISPTGPSFDSNDFRERVEKIFRLLGYSVKTGQTFPGCDAGIIAEYRTGMIPLRILVNCQNYSNTKIVDVEEVSRFAFALSGAKNKGIVDKGVFVTNYGFAVEAKEFAFPVGIELITFADLSTQLVDFDNYIEGIIEDFRISPAGKYYVDLSGSETEDYEAGGLSFLQRPLDNLVNRCLSPVGKGKLALLGNFGTGKTTFCKKYAYDLAIRCKNDPTARIPIVINLKDYDSKLDIQELISNTLQNRHGVRIDLTLSRELQRLGRFVLLFDGFDEMATRVDFDTIRENLREINKVSAIRENVYILTCRTHFFRDRVQVEVLSDFDIIYIPEWGESELQEYIQKRFGDGWENHFERIRGTHNLPELAQTPLFLEMIVETLPKLGDQVRRSELYQVYTDNWIHDESRRKGARLSSDERRQFVNELAVNLYRDGRMSCHHSEFVPMLRQRFGIDDAAQMDYLRSDVQNCTFLIRDANGNYSFRHKSFMEFFVAQSIVNQIRLDSHELLSIHLLPQEIRGFLIDTLSNNPPIEIFKQWMHTSSEQTLKENLLSLSARLRIDISVAQLGSGSTLNAETLLAMRFLRGESNAYDEIVTRYHMQIDSYIRSYLTKRIDYTNRTLDSIRDLVSDVFIRAFEYKDRLSSITNLSGYLTKIATNVCSDFIREQQQEILLPPLSMDELKESGVEIMETAISPYETIRHEELKENITRTILELPEETRTIVSLRLFNDLTFSDISQKLGLSLTQVSRRYNVGLQYLREHLKDYIQEN